MPREIPENLDSDIKDQYLVSSEYSTFLGMIITGCFTILGIILTISDLTDLINFGYLFYCVLLLVISIFLSFQSLGGFIWYKRTILLGEEDLYYYHIGNTNWYGGIYTFILSIIYLLLNVEGNLIAFIAYLLLYLSVLDWFCHFFDMRNNLSKYCAEFKELRSGLKDNMFRDLTKNKNGVEKTPDEIYQTNKKRLRAYNKRIFQTKVFRISLYISSVLFFIIYYGFLGFVIIWELVQGNRFANIIIILYYITYSIIWSIKIFFRIRTST